MTSVQRLDSVQNYKKPKLTPKNTGYMAVGAMALTSLRAFSKSKTVRKTHKVFAWLSVALTALHVGLVEYYNLKFKKSRMR